jgi:sugar phosphate isomerase/epimerase
MIELAAELGTPCLRVFGGAVPENTARSALLPAAAEVLHALGSYGAEQGVTVAIETHDSWTRSEDILALLQAVALPTVGVLWDAHHTYRAGEDPAHTLALLAPALTYVHLKDSLPTPGQPGAWTYCLLNEGDVPLKNICALLKQAGYDGYLSLEWEKKWHPEIAEPELALPQAVPQLLHFWQSATAP